MAARPKQQPAAKPKAKAAAAPQRIATRSELVRGVFDTFDKDSDDLLNPQELRKFADSVGFEGDEADWVEWYRDTCAEVGANRKMGVDRAQFMKLIQDADDEDLVRLCGKRRPQAAVKHALILNTLFDLFDRDCDGFLNRVELRRFFDNIDFDGDDNEWDDRYVRECKDVGADPQKGVERGQFADVAQRACTDSELDMLLKELDSLNEQPIALDVWSKLQPSSKSQTPDALDEADLKVVEEFCQMREPKAPEKTLEGMPMVPQKLNGGPPSPKKDRSGAKLDADEFELDNLRKQLNGHITEPKAAVKIQFTSVADVKQVKAN